jgi:hypothetical protein
VGRAGQTDQQKDPGRLGRGEGQTREEAHSHAHKEKSQRNEGQRCGSGSRGEAKNIQKKKRQRKRKWDGGSEAGERGDKIIIIIIIITIIIKEINKNVQQIEIATRICFPYLKLNIYKVVSSLAR